MILYFLLTARCWLPDIRLSFLIGIVLLGFLLLLEKVNIDGMLITQLLIEDLGGRITAEFNSSLFGHYFYAPTHVLHFKMGTRHRADVPLLVD